MREIFTALLEQMRAGSDVMLATMVSHAGSVPRGMGSQMALTKDGRIAGTIGGGVGEKAMTDYGMKLLAQRQSGLHTYALHGQTGQRLGSVCGGEITVAFQFIAAEDGAWQAMIAALLERIAQRQGGWMVLPLGAGAPALLDENCMPLCGTTPEHADALCRPFSVRGEDCFVLPLYVGERAVLFGAGHCAQALVPLLASVGFRVTVYDDRSALAQKALFPQAEEVICAPYDEISQRLALYEDDYVVAMSSTHASDLIIQRQVLAMDHAYTGMLGSKPKREFIHGKLLEYGVPQSRIDSVHTPIGLPIQAVTPAEIAISIAAEMVCVRAQNRKKA